MRSDLVVSLVVGRVLILLISLPRWLCRRSPTAPRVPQRTRATREPKPFAGDTRTPECALCDAGMDAHPQAPGAPPPRMIFTRGRRRQVDTTGQCCPQATCSYSGGVDWGTIRANGHPHGRPWRQRVCLSCSGSFLETHDTPFHAKQVDPDTLVWAMAALAAGRGIRAVARVFEAAPHTGLGWLVEAAEHLEACTHSHGHDLPVEQVQRDALCAVLSAVQEGKVTEAEAMQRLSRSPHGVWVAMAPGCKVMLAVDSGDRTLAMAQRLVPHVTQVLAPACAPLLRTEGLREYRTALVTHDGRWMPPARRQAKGPRPKPRWLPHPQLRYAQVGKSYRRRRIVGGKHRMVCGAAEPIESILEKRGWQINTAFIERLTFALRQHGAAISRRVNTRGKHEAGWRQQLVLCQAYHNFVLPHARLRVPLPDLMDTMASGRRWQPRTPAMAAGLTDRVWSVRELLMSRVPPWPQRPMGAGLRTAETGHKPRGQCV